MKKNILTISILLLIALLLSACGEEEPTEDVAAAIFTLAAQTADAELTLAALNAPPTNTPLPPSPTPQIVTETPTQLVIPTSSLSQTPDTLLSPSPTESGAIQTATSTQAALATATTALSLPPTATIPTSNTSDCYKARFVAETDPYDYHSLVPNLNKNKLWRIQNTGTCAWTDQFSVVLVAAIKDGQYVQDTMGVTPVMVAPFMEFINGTATTIDPLESVWISISFTTPSERGTYELHFRFQAPDGTIFGIDGDGAFWVIFVVK